MSSDAVNFSYVNVRSASDVYIEILIALPLVELKLITLRL